jgi:ubiquinone/menaquinone biosynthesis C-methylase UbiE
MVESAIVYDDTSFRKFLNWTNQTEKLGKEILGLTKPSDKSLLDIGAGNGDLTETYIGRFEQALLLEPTQAFYEGLRERFPRATIKQIKAEDFRSEASRFDLIVASHVLYYVSEPFEVIDRLLSSLTTGGRLVMILVNKDCSYLQFIDAYYFRITGMEHHFTDITWTDILAYLKTQSLRCEARDVPISIDAPSLDDFLDVSDFIFNVVARQIPGEILAEMRTYLKAYLTADGLRLDASNKIMVVEK